MTEVDRLAQDARIPRELASLLAEAAHLAEVSLRSFRADDRRPHLVRARDDFVLRARNRGYGGVLIGRALNRDSSSILSAGRRALARAEADRRRPPAAGPTIQLDFLPGPLFDFARAA